MVFADGSSGTIWLQICDFPLIVYFKHVSMWVCFRDTTRTSSCSWTRSYMMCNRHTSQWFSSVSNMLIYCYIVSTGEREKWWIWYTAIAHNNVVLLVTLVLFDRLQIDELDWPTDRTTNERRRFCFIRFTTNEPVDWLCLRPRHNICGKPVIQSHSYYCQHIFCCSGTIIAFRKMADVFL